MVIIEEPSRLARQVLTYELAVVLLQSRGVEVYASNGDCLTATEDEMATAMRQIVMVFSQLEKHHLVKKMKAARDRIKAGTGKCEGRKSHAELNPALVREAKRLRRRNPKTGKRRWAGCLRYWRQRRG